MRPLNDYFLTTRIADVSTANTEALVAVPDGGEVIAIYSVLGGTIATADVVLTASINGTAITGGAITIAYDGSAEGDVDVVYPTAANAVTEGQFIKINSGGQSTNAIAAEVTIVIRR